MHVAPSSHMYCIGLRELELLLRSLVTEDTSQLPDLTPRSNSTRALLTEIKFRACVCLPG